MNFSKKQLVKPSCGCLPIWVDHKIEKEDFGLTLD
jgi:hypothetical protein